MLNVYGLRAKESNEKGLSVTIEAHNKNRQTDYNANGTHSASIYRRWQMMKSRQQHKKTLTTSSRSNIAHHYKGCVIFLCQLLL